jgi:bacterioferritin-associated ferredoxin
MGVDAMFVCLCLGVTSREVADAAQKGAGTSKEVAAACGAGSDCGRCRPTVRALITSAKPELVTHLRGDAAAAGSRPPHEGTVGHRFDNAVTKDYFCHRDVI